MEMVVALIILFLGGVGGFIWFSIDGFGADIGSTICFIVMLLIFPSIFLIGGIYIFAAQIQIDENGITKSLFGIKQKFYRWDEISYVRFYGNIVTLSISFYKKRKENTLLYRLSKYERIYFFLDNDRRAVIDFYAPKYIKEKYLKKK